MLPRVFAIVVLALATKQVNGKNVIYRHSLKYIGWVAQKHSLVGRVGGVVFRFQTLQQTVI